VEREGAARYRDPPVNVSGRYIVISLAEHRLYLMEQERVIWSALVGTGTGTRLEGAGQKWDFSTPRGMFRVQLKEKNPIWRVPDWAFIERGVPIPPIDSPQRLEPGMLGHHRDLPRGGYRGSRHQQPGAARPGRLARLHPHEQRRRSPPLS
jgi:hypothetical protein